MRRPDTRSGGRWAVVIASVLVLAGCAAQQAINTASRAVTAAASQTATAAAAATQPAATQPSAGGPAPSSGRGRVVRYKRNGRGGFDVSAQQQAALARAHRIRDRYGVIRTTRSPATQPSPVRNTR